MNADGSCEIDLFREYLPRGEIYVDETRGFYDALGKRSFFTLFSQSGLMYARQRAKGMRERRIEGNFHGVTTDPLLLGGILLVTPSGEVVWVHQEGNGPVPYDDLEGVLVELASSVGSAVVLEKGPGEEKSWLEGAVDGLLSFFG